MEPVAEAQVVALVRDLMFGSKITATARAEGVAVRMVRDPAKVLATPGLLLLVDLNLAGATEAAAAWRAGGDRRVVGFVSHVDTAAIEHARAQGVDQVMARSQFVNVLPELLRAGR